MSPENLAAFYAATAAVEKSVTISIDGNDLELLKTNNYSLCFARGVSGSFNVIWRSTASYLHRTIFSWTPQYTVFATPFAKPGARVFPETNLQPIELGQQSVLDAAGNLLPPSTGGPATAITMINQLGPIHPGLSGMATLNGDSGSTPFYVAPEAMVLGTAAMTPADSLLVWFDLSPAPSAMFATARSLSVEIDLGGSNQAHRLYQNGQWSTP